MVSVAESAGRSENVRQEGETLMSWDRIPVYKVREKILEVLSVSRKQIKSTNCEKSQVTLKKIYASWNSEEDKGSEIK